MTKVILSGSSGFLGTIIQQTLLFEFITIGRSNAEIICNLAKEIPKIQNQATIVIHAAGKAHSIPKTSAEKQEFFDVNVKGTQNLLTGLERIVLLKNFVFISTAAVYGKTEGTQITEDAPLNAQDAYGLSKIQAENIVQEWCAKNNVICTILRLPLLAGPNPPGNLGSMINGIKKGYYFNIAGGKARKSIVLVEDVAEIIPKAAETGGIFNLTDGYHPSFFELSELIAKQLGKSKPMNLPYWIAASMAKAGDIFGSKSPINSDKLRKITSHLTFDDSKARKTLGWNPRPVLEGFRVV